jgi:septal ring-binding cell division protein DamX
MFGVNPNTVKDHSDWALMNMLGNCFPVPMGKRLFAQGVVLLMSEKKPKNTKPVVARTLTRSLTPLSINSDDDSDAERALFGSPNHLHHQQRLRAWPSGHLEANNAPVEPVNNDGVTAIDNKHRNDSVKDTPPEEEAPVDLDAETETYECGSEPATAHVLQHESGESEEESPLRKPC